VFSAAREKGDGRDDADPPEESRKRTSSAMERSSAVNAALRSDLHCVGARGCVKGRDEHRRTAPLTQLQRQRPSGYMARSTVLGVTESLRNFCVGDKIRITSLGACGSTSLPQLWGLFSSRTDFAALMANAEFCMRKRLMETHRNRLEEHCGRRADSGFHACVSGSCPTAKRVAPRSVRKFDEGCGTNFVCSTTRICVAS